MLCKHEVVGSIPSGSTRWNRRSRVLLFKGLPFKHRPRNITSHVASFTGCACGISDIVKRRLIRVWDLRSNTRIAITISGTFRRSFIAR